MEKSILYLYLLCNGISVSAMRQRLGSGSYKLPLAIISLPHAQLCDSTIYTTEKLAVIMIGSLTTVHPVIESIEKTLSVSSDEWWKKRGL